MRSKPTFRSWSCLPAAVILSAACSFSPQVPDGIITCNADTDCPNGLVCAATATAAAPRLCCRDGACPGQTGGGGLPPIGPAVPPLPGSEPSASQLVTCSLRDNRAPTLGAQDKLFCTISAEDDSLNLGLDVITADDPLTLLTAGFCKTDLRLGAESVDPATGQGRAVGKPALDTMVAAVKRMEQICGESRGAFIGAVASGWARRVTNLPEIATRLQTEAGITLDVPDEAQEVVHRYLGASRNRRSHIVYNEWLDVPEILVWPSDAPGPTRYEVPVSFSDVGSVYMADARYTSFLESQTAVRAQLASMRTVFAELSRLVTAGRLLPSVVVGPTTNATIPLAIKGQLRDAASGWFDPQRYQATIGRINVVPSPNGWIFGLVSPAEVDAFIPSISARDFTQLRSEPILGTYGEWVTLTTTILESLNKEARASEFAFTLTNSYFGYLFTKRYTGPSER